VALGFTARRRIQSAFLFSTAAVMTYGGPMSLGYSVLPSELLLCPIFRVSLAYVGVKIVTWLILPVVICLSQRLSHACLSISKLYRETANGSLYQS
jgi:hypothetical protein